MLFTLNVTFKKPYRKHDIAVNLTRNLLSENKKYLYCADSTKT